MTVNWDIDTLPSDTILVGKTKIDYIIDPLKTNPESLKFVGLRLLLLDESIGSITNQDGADAWKNQNGTDFVAGANDIVEWNGSSWNVIFDSSEHTGDVVYVTNLNTNIQYKFINNQWILSYEGEYPYGTWRVNF